MQKRRADQRTINQEAGAQDDIYRVIMHGEIVAFNVFTLARRSESIVRA